MRVLFVHDHVFQVSSDASVFSPGRLPYSSWQRYLEAFDEVTVLARSRPLTSASSNLNVSSGPRVSFAFDHGFRGPRDLLLRRGGVRASIARRVATADAVIARLPSELGAMAIGAAVRIGRPYAVEVVGCAFDGYWNYGSALAKVYAPVMCVRMRRLIRAAPFALYVTRAFLQHRYPTAGRSASISNVQLGEPDEEVLGRRLRRIAQSSQGIVLGFLGSLQSTAKGLGTALRGLRALKDEGRSVELRVLGEGDKSRWQELADRLGISEVTRFDGVVPAGDAVYRWLDDVDLLIQPSKTEGLPRSILEAMSRGCSVVGSSVGGIPELLPRECLHPPGSWRELAGRVAKIAWSTQKKAELAERNWRASSAYATSKLEQARKEFWCQFARYAATGR